MLPILRCAGKDAYYDRRIKVAVSHVNPGQGGVHTHFEVWKGRGARHEYSENNEQPHLASALLIAA